MSYRPSSPIAGLPAAVDQILVNYLHSRSSVNTNGSTGGVLGYGKLFRSRDLKSSCDATPRIFVWYGCKGLM